MLKDFFDRLLFRGRAARRVIHSLEARMSEIEQKLALIVSCPPPSDDFPEQVSRAVQNVKVELRGSIGEIITALERESLVIRGLESQMLDLRLSHPDGTHRELCREIDELRSRIELLEGGASKKPGDETDGQETTERNETGA
jgi:hypothetical protein